LTRSAHRNRRATIGLDRILGPANNRCRDLILALIAARLIDPGSKLAAARALSPATATTSPGEVLGLGAVDDRELYRARSTGSANASLRSRRRWPSAL
jgi:hypothetical protein